MDRKPQTHGSITTQSHVGPHDNNYKQEDKDPDHLNSPHPERAQPINTVLTAHTPFSLTYTDMFSNNRTPTPIGKPASPASENEVENALVSATTQGKVAEH